METSTLLLSAFLSLQTTFAQAGPQNASLPDCIRPCDTAAIRVANCSAVDQLCHCRRYLTIVDSLAPCSYETCGAAARSDLAVYESLFQSVCDQFNITLDFNQTAAPNGTLRANATASGGAVDAPSIAVSAAAANEVRGRVWPAMMGLTGLAIVI